MAWDDARAGDAVSVESHRLSGARRRGEILEVLGEGERRRYRVRWDDGRETIFHPADDAELHPKGRRARRAKPVAARARPAPPAAAAGADRRPRPELRAAPGDRLVIHGHQLGRPPRDAEILEALGPRGTAPFRVRWSDTGRESILRPGDDAAVEHFPRRRRAARRG